MSSKLKAVIFDLDGLLFNSEPVWSKAYDIFLKKHNTQDKPEYWDEITGMGLREAVKLMIDKFGLKGDPDELTEDWRRIFCEIFLKEKDVLMLGSRELIKDAKKQGLSVGLTTGGHTEVMTRKMLKNVGLLSYFDLVVSSDDVQKGKPDSDVYIYAANKLNLKPGSCLALEDSVNGILAAKAAGMRVFGINGGKKTRQELKKAGADKVYRSLSEIRLEDIG